MTTESSLTPIAGSAILTAGATPGDDPALALALATNPEFQSMWLRIGERTEREVARSTEANYRRMADAFDGWRKRHGFQPSANSLALYIETLFRQGRKPRYLNNVRHGVCWRYPDIKAQLKGNIYFENFLRSIRRESKTAQKQAKPIRYHDFRIILRTAGIPIRAKAMIAAMRDGLLRGQEARNVTYQDVVVNPQTGSATVLVRFSKTDQEGQGAVVWLSPQTVSLLQAAGLDVINRSDDDRLFPMGAKRMNTIFRETACGLRISPAPVT